MHAGPSPPSPLVLSAIDRHDDAQTPWRHALLLLAASTLLRLALGAAVPLFADEAYYWDWSRQLAFGYFDHPPVIAWLIASGTAVFGDTPFGVRVVPILVGSTAGLAIVATALHLAGAAAARFAALVFAVLPLSVAGLVLATPDAPLLAAIALTLFHVVRALDPTASRLDATSHWIGAGIAIGVAMASKFTGVFVPMAVALALLVHPGLRHHLRAPGPWLAVAVASLVLLPVLVWNAHHEWIAFRFQLGHGLGSTSRGSWWQRELDLIGGQLALVTPILCVLLVGAVHRAFTPRGDPRRFALATVTVFCLGFFLYSATRKSVEANWPAIAWIPAVALLAASRAGRRSRWERAGVGLAAALTAIALAHVVFPFIPFPPSRDPVAKAHGWEALAVAAEAERGELSQRGTKVFVAAQRYQDAALLAFHMDGHPDVTAINLLGRRNQYDLWPRFADVARSGEALLLAVSDTGASPALVSALQRHFDAFEPRRFVVLTRNGAPVAARRLWLLAGWRGTWPDDPNDPRPIQ